MIIVDAVQDKYNETKMTKKIMIRTLCRFIPLDQFSFLFSDNGQFWHDEFCKTKVILNKIALGIFLNQLNNNTTESINSSNASAEHSRIVKKTYTISIH